jgi:hypothetical protein
VLQGLTRDIEQVEPYLGMWTMLEPRGFSTYRSAAAIFRLGRSCGISLTTIETLIAAIAMEHGASVFTLDQDFVRIAQLASLTVHQFGERARPTLSRHDSVGLLRESGDRVQQIVFGEDFVLAIPHIHKHRRTVAGNVSGDLVDPG